MRCIKYLACLLLLLGLAACSTTPKKTAGTPEQQQRYQLALAAMEQGDDDKAMDLLKAFIKDSPEYAGPHANLAKLYQRKGEQEKAGRSFERAIALEPQSAAIYNAAGMHERQLGRFDEAEKHYLAAIKREPRNPDVLLNLGILYDLYLRQPSRAVVFYRRYQATLDQIDPRVALWIADLERRQAQAE